MVLVSFCLNYLEKYFMSRHTVLPFTPDNVSTQKSNTNNNSKLGSESLFKWKERSSILLSRVVLQYLFPTGRLII